MILFVCIFSSRRSSRINIDRRHRHCQQQQQRQAVQGRVVSGGSGHEHGHHGRTGDVPRTSGLTRGHQHGQELHPQGETWLVDSALSYTCLPLCRDSCSTLSPRSIGQLWRICSPRTLVLAHCVSRQVSHSFIRWFIHTLPIARHPIRQLIICKHYQSLLRNRMERKKEKH